MTKVPRFHPAIVNTIRRLFPRRLNFTERGKETLRQLRKCILLVVILLFVSKVFAQPEQNRLPYRVPERVWKAEINSLDETAPFSVSDYKGKVNLLAVWA